MIARGHKRRLGGGYRCPTPERSSLLAYAQSQLRVPVYTGILVLRCFRCGAAPDHSQDSAPDRPGGISIVTSAPVATTTESWRLRLPSSPPIRPWAGAVNRHQPVTLPREHHPRSDADEREACEELELRRSHPPLE